VRDNPSLGVHFIGVKYWPIARSQEQCSTPTNKGLKEEVGNGDYNPGS
jgi:hypothetical protein